MRIIYARSLTIGGALLRLLQWIGPWSHCGLVTPEATVINARAFQGVVEEPLAQFLVRYSAVEYVDVPAQDDAAGLAFARSQVGAGYDYGALVRFISKRFGLMQDMERWECVELVETALRAAGRDRFRVDSSRVTLSQSYIVR